MPLNMQTIKNPWVAALLTLIVAVIAVFLRSNQLGEQILIDDEWHAVHGLIHLDYQRILLSFGEADRSIPLTLFFKLMADTIGLSEWRMRMLPWIGGLATVLVVPYLLRPWLKSYEPWIAGLLIAISPLLIHFSRYARPYGLTVPLAFAAVIALWRWWHDRDRRWLVLFVPATVLAAWLHPLTLMFTGGALLWFGLASLKDLLRDRNMAGLMRVVPVGLLTVALTSALVLPPLLADPSSMAAKTGVHQIEWETVIWGWELSVGTAHWGMASLMLVFAVVGGVTFFKRDRYFAGYWLFLLALACATLVALNPAWVHHALVPVRYMSPLLPVLLTLIAIGFWTILRWVNQFSLRPLTGPITVLALSLWIAGLIGSGPLIETYGLLNQFAAAQRYHFDYDFDDNAYVKALEGVELPAIYERMAEEPGEWWLIEAPWNFASHSTHLVGFQRKHQMPMKVGMMSGLCTNWSAGEVPYQSTETTWLFDGFLHLADLPQAQSDKNRFLVLNRQSIYENIPVDDAMDSCVAQLSMRLGEAWYQDEYRVIYRLPSDR